MLSSKDILNNNSATSPFHTRKLRRLDACELPTATRNACMIHQKRSIKPGDTLRLLLDRSHTGGDCTCTYVPYAINNTLVHENTSGRKDDQSGVGGRDSVRQALPERQRDRKETETKRERGERTVKDNVRDHRIATEESTRRLLKFSSPLCVDTQEWTASPSFVDHLINSSFTRYTWNQSKSSSIFTEEQPRAQLFRESGEKTDVRKRKGTALTNVYRGSRRLSNRTRKRQ